MTVNVRSDAASPSAASSFLRVQEMIHGYCASQVIGVAARLDLADQIAAGVRSEDELARATGAHPAALSRLLRACAAIGLVEQADPGCFALTPLGECLLSEGPSLRDVAIGLTGPSMWLPAGRLYDAVMTGEATAERALGTDLYAYHSQNADEAASFGAAMSQRSANIVRDIVARYDVSRFGRIVDVGGSRGELLAAMLEAAPGAKGVLFDLPEVVEQGRETLRRRGLADRVEFVGGDFFESVPEGGDLYVVKDVLCDWGEGGEGAIRIVRNCHRASAADGHIVTVQPVVPAPSDPAALYLSLGDLITLAATGGHALRTVDEYRALFEEGGYQLVKFVTISGDVTVIEGKRSHE